MAINRDGYLYPQWVAERFKYFTCFGGPEMMDVFKDNFQLLISTAIVVTIIFLIYYYLFLPWDLKWDLCDMGFDYLTDGYYNSVRHNAKNKRELVREVQKLRKIGDLPPVYPNGWFVLLESEDLKKNEVKHVVALGENFAVFRNDKGEVKILDAYCPHLGANMAIGGKVHGNCVECPFHSWRFDGDTGHCSSIPYSEKTPDFIKVKKWTSIEVNEFIFVWYHAENGEPSWYPEEVDVIKNKKWPFHGRSEFLIGCHIQDIPENISDISHFNIIHGPSVFDGSDLRFYEKFYWKFLRHHITVQWYQDPDKRHIGIMNGSGDTRIFNKFLLSRDTLLIRHNGPGSIEIRMDTPLGPLLFFETVTPVEALVQKVTHRVYAPYKLTILAKLILYVFGLMLSRDAMVWNHKNSWENRYYLRKIRLFQRFEDGSVNFILKTAQDLISRKIR